ncbi:hypothetical protein A3C91_01995 [Candidatus Azambacteria bacterium RIFCSPHIGHO2_02_FULL_52_12]|uniref:Uncharacterized protein n=1 Tax=Candidatus Azambacteria bacterium RIFCSPLOWO2_01_FULL_46_25 TaxID=1797298 RepID=A0A1F5BVH0_9BACT|nr:MAG: hypothetical protein A3C91_01995 [Candidatus Azambacteria bacterium RIFCSPHIGHO2_02_FULL_52_12]OGD34610.1 MAG: hypothetical protein A2988_03855 [Candidatus Azambacteria bacterium RIFCSPLOWO2_01_FULL_46_25]OGD37496.1 MAG: hypothetical protein A2850_03285 [Candidatus Azambacteria bacterium RIFCSPHIGHO2_01_FULL_51_74]
MTHYICTGGCGGVSDKPGVCQDENCPKHGMPLDQCGCTDGSHNGALENKVADKDSSADPDEDQ